MYLSLYNIYMHRYPPGRGLLYNCQDLRKMHQMDLEEIGSQMQALCSRKPGSSLTENYCGW